MEEMAVCRARSQFLSGNGLFHLPEECFCLVCCGKATLRGNLELISGLNSHCETADEGSVSGFQEAWEVLVQRVSSSNS